MQKGSLAAWKIPNTGDELKAHVNQYRTWLGVLTAAHKKVPRSAAVQLKEWDIEGVVTTDFDSKGRVLGAPT